MHQRFLVQFTRSMVLGLILVFLGPGAALAQTVAYVVNYGDHTVTVIDVATTAEVAVIPVITDPYALAVTPDGGKVFVSSASASSISVIDTSTTTVSTHFIGAGHTVFAPAVTPDGQHLWVPTDFGIYVFRASDMGYVDQINTLVIGLAFDPSTKIAYGVTSEAVVRMYWTTRAMSTPIAAPTGNYQILPAQPIAMVARYGGVWMTGGAGNPLTLIARMTATVAVVIPMGQYTDNVAIAPDGTKTYVTDPFSGTVNILDLATLQVDPAPLSVTGPVGLAVTPDSASLYVCSSLGTVFVFNKATKALTATIPVGTTPAGIAIFRLKAPFVGMTVKQMNLSERKVSITGGLTLAANGVLDLSTQDVVVTIGDATIIIPAGQVKSVGPGGHYLFTGTLNGQPVKFSLDADAGSTTTFTYRVQIQNFTTPLPNPVTVTIAIGNNTGTMSASY